MIVYGTQYYRPPYPHAGQWKEDLIRIKQSNFNTLKLWAVWSWIERKEGGFYFDDLDTLVDLSQDIGLQVVINTIPEGVPAWVARRYPDAKYRSSEGQVIELGGAANMPSGGSPGLCADKHEVQSLLGNFITTVVERYSHRNHLLAFDVWNEPHIEPIWDYPEAIFCYCEHSKARFLEWLQGKYGDIERLNQAWTRAYQGWEDVSPPVRFGTYPDMIDWRSFWIENLGAWLERRAQAARKAARGKAVMTHVPFSGYIGGSGEGGLGQHLGDEFVLVEKVDQFGLTSFPKWLMQNDFVQHLLNLEMVASASRQKVFWQSELQSGAGKWEAYGRPVALPDEIRLWNWSAIACGAKGVLYWQWRPEPSGTEAPGFGLTSLDGGLSERTRAAAGCAAAFNAVQGFDRALRVPPLNGIYVSRAADLCLYAANRGERLYAKALYGAYQACFEAGIPVQMVHADHLSASMASGLQVLYLPAAVALSAAELLQLKQFVLAGGTLVSEACPGLFDEKGVLQGDGWFLEQVFGLADQVVDSQEQNRIQFTAEMQLAGQEAAFHGKYYRQHFLKIDPGVKVLAHFEDGSPAVYEHGYGDGRAILIGSLPSLSVAGAAEAPAAGVICRWMDPCGYPQIRRVEGGQQVHLRLHRSGDQTYLTVVNYRQAQASVEIEFASAWEAEDGELAPDGRSIRLELGGRNGRILPLKRPGSLPA